MTVIEIRNRLRAQSRTPVRHVSAPAETANPTLVFENPDSGRTMMNVALETAAQSPRMLRLSGRLVEAEHANRNKAFWSTGDLEFGLQSVALGPLNWLHEEQKIIGTLVDPTLERGGQGLGQHIRTDAVAWKWIYPEETAALQEHISEGKAWLSMECVSDKLQCGECGKTYSYEVAQSAWFKGTAGTCEHLREHSAHKRFVNPTFLGAGVIVPPAAPGWANADLDMKARAEQYAEAARFGVLSDAEAAQMVLAMIEWSAR